jgi:alcohol oxidase
VETYHIAEGQDTHGYDGPAHVSLGGRGDVSPLYYDFAASLKLQGIDEAEDIMDFESINKLSKWAKWIDPRTGKRCDAAHSYLHPILPTHPNLVLALETTVTRALFSGTKAIGIEYITKYTRPSPI